MKTQTHTTNKAMNTIRKDIAIRLKKSGLTFFECSSRMNYGMIGEIKKRNESQVILFRGSFYVHDKMFSCNAENIELISDIQNEFSELTRDDKNQIAISENGIGDVDVIYRLWDNSEKNLLNNQSFFSIEQAGNAKENFLGAGNYPDKPHTVISIHEFVNGEFKREII